MKEVPEEKRIAFIEDIVKISKKHNLTLSHEDGHGSFTVEPYSIHNINWLENAYSQEFAHDIEI